MSPTTDPRYFGKSALSDLQGVAGAALKVLQGNPEEEVKTEESPEATTTEPEEEKSDG